VVALPFFPAGTGAGSGAGGEAGSWEIGFTGRLLSVTSGEGGREKDVGEVVRAVVSNPTSPLTVLWSPLRYSAKASQILDNLCSHLGLRRQGFSRSGPETDPG